VLKTEADLLELVRADLAIQLEDDVAKLAKKVKLFDRTSGGTSTRSNGFLSCPFGSNGQIRYPKI
jgi:hypothetical protein